MASVRLRSANLYAVEIELHGLLERPAVKVIGSPMKHGCQLQQLFPAIREATESRKFTELDRHLSVILTVGERGVDWRLPHKRCCHKHPLAASQASLCSHHRDLRQVLPSPTSCSPGGLTTMFAVARL
jgi:hypothetical protein